MKPAVGTSQGPLEAPVRSRNSPVAGCSGAQQGDFYVPSSSFVLFSEIWGCPIFILFKNSFIEDFPGGPVVKTLLPLQGTWVRSLVGEQRSHKTRDSDKKKEKALLRYNSHTIQFSRLKSTVSGFSVSTDAATITTVHVGGVSSRQRETPYPVAATPCAPRPAAGSRSPALCLYRFTFSGLFALMESYNTWTSASGFFHLA